eukprot:gene38791-47909_t
MPQSLNEQLSREQQIAALEKDWATNPRWKGVKRGYSAADVVEKIEWLKAHDKEAQQIATNGRNFALSYLRLEDQYCYVATLLETLGELQKNSDAIEPFAPKKM